MTPFFTIIIPCFNASKTITRTLESCRNQSYKNFEIIVVDDGSSDTSILSITAFAEANAAVTISLISQTNQGPSTARNNGIAQARGTFIAFLDADDYFHSHKLETVVAAIRQFPNARLFGHNMSVSSEKMLYDSFEAPIFLAREWAFSNLFLSNFLSTSTVVVARDALPSVPFNTTIRHCEDYECWLQIALQHAIVILPQVLTTANRQAQSLSSNNALMYKRACTLLQRFYPQLESILGSQEARFYQRISANYQRRIYLSFERHQGHLLTVKNFLMILLYGWERFAVQLTRSKQRRQFGRYRLALRQIDLVWPNDTRTPQQDDQGFATKNERSPVNRPNP